jgi:dTDP-4-dehydrorhamnose reductase
MTNGECPTFVDDLAYACQLAIEREAQGIFHISGAELMSINEAVYAVADYWQLDKSLISEISAASIGQADNRPRQTGFDLSKSKNELGYVPTPFVESLAIIDRQSKELGR